MTLPVFNLSYNYTKFISEKFDKCIWQLVGTPAATAVLTA